MFLYPATKVSSLRRYILTSATCRSFSEEMVKSTSPLTYGSPTVSKRTRFAGYFAANPTPSKENHPDVFSTVSIVPPYGKQSLISPSAVVSFGVRGVSSVPLALGGSSCSTGISRTLLTTFSISSPAITEPLSVYITAPYCIPSQNPKKGSTIKTIAASVFERVVTVVNDVDHLASWAGAPCGCVYSVSICIQYTPSTCSSCLSFPMVALHFRFDTIERAVQSPHGRRRL